MRLDLLDIHFAVQSTPVYSHPLSKSTTIEPLPNEYKKVVEDDPLAVSATTSTKNGKVDFFDPLGACESDRLDDLDIGKLSGNASLKKQTLEKNSDSVEVGSLTNTLQQQDDSHVPDLDPVINGFAPWTEMKVRILAEFTATDQLSIESSFLSNESTANTGIPKKSRKGEEVKAEACVKLTGLSQIEFEQKIRDLRRLLLFLWEQERRIDSIKLVVEVCRMLSSVSVPQYYPSLFVHVCDFLDIFGDLVYQRLLSKAKAERVQNKFPPLPTHFSTSDILETTRMTARNWFGKVQEIREVLPRIYVELALLRCMKFMDDTAIAANLMRMGTLVRSVQHPLVSSYARCYTCRVAMRLKSDDRSPHWLCLNDWMQTYTTQPVCLLWPALEYIVQCVAHGAVTYNDLLPIWEYCGVNNRRTVILCSFLNGIPKFYLAQFALEATKLVTNAEEVTAEELCTLGNNLNKIDVDEKYQKAILRSAWKSVTRIVPITSFLSAVHVWVQFVVKYFTTKELGIILDFVIQQVTPNKVFEFHYRALASILAQVVEHSSDICNTLELDVFTRFLDIFRKDSVRTEVANTILAAFVQGTRRGSLTDLKLAYQVIDVCKKLHDSVSIYSSEAEIDTVNLLVRSALDRFQLDSDPERMLEFLVGCRAAMMNVDKIQKYIVLRMLALTLDITRRSQFSSARAAFLHSCVANLFITIPSLENPVDRIQLYVQSAQVALASQAFLFIDGFLQATLKDFGEILNAVEFSQLASFFLALVVTAPDPVDDEQFGPIFILAKFLKIVRRFPWPKTNVAEQQRARVTLALLQAVLYRRRLYDRAIVAAGTEVQFRWIDRSEEAKSRHVATIDELIAAITVDLVSPLQAESGYSLNLEFVEIVAKFAPDELVVTLADLAKDTYKRLRKFPETKSRLEAARKGADL